VLTRSTSGNWYRFDVLKLTYFFHDLLELGFQVVDVVGTMRRQLHLSASLAEVNHYLDPGIGGNLCLEEILDLEDTTDGSLRDRCSPSTS
jgi:hypothetical protein